MNDPAPNPIDLPAKEAAAAAPAAAPALSLIVEHARRVNFAMQQNGVPAVRRIAISNRSEHDAEEVVVRARLGGEFAEPWEGRIARIAPGTTYNLTEVRLRLSPGVLARQTEREATELTVEAVIGERIAASRIDPIDVLAANEWGGGAEFPEALAAFVTPNHPAIDGLLVEAGRLLGQWTGDGGLAGYQGKSAARARAQVAAIYTAMAARGIGYINPPASFESSGQKVRLADQVLDGKLGTCLDLALVLAAAIEQAGLHPLIFVLRDHAFVGAWLTEETFADPIVDAPSRIINRVELDEMVILEATGVTSSPRMDFDAAARRARSLLDDRERFAWALDVRAARRALVRPLPVRVGGVGGVVFVPAEGGAGEAEAPASIHAAERDSAAAEGGGVEASRTRLDRWKRKLLDLSLRNRLINYRPTAQSVELECPDIGALEDALAGGAKFELLPRPEALVRGADPNEAGGAAAPAQLEARRLVLAEELSNRRLRTVLSPAELATRLTGIYRAARVSLDENGANTLFLALGSLVWYESAESETPRTAPLLMLPLTMERRSVSEGFRVLLADEDARINTTLVEKLSQEFGIDVRALREPPEDESGVDVAMVLRRFREAIKHIDRWEVRETAHVGLFTFSKFLMWLDLQERAEDLRRSRVVRYLVDRPDEPFDGEPFPDAARLDVDARVAETFCPLDSDSSQLAAVRAACDGRTFVLEGPPGTGKSQTITNLIAQSLAAGKRVLFVAEKMAALSVVQRRLERVGLAPFCLEVHSNKASKKEVLEQIARAFDTGKRAEPADFPALAAELEEVRAELNEFVRVLHMPRASGESYYEVAARLIGLQRAPEVEMPLGDAAAMDGAMLARLRSQIEALRVAAGTVGDLPTHPLREFGRGAWTDGLPEQVRGGIGAVEAALGPAVEALRGFAGALVRAQDVGAIETWSRAGVEWLVRLAAHLRGCPGVTEALLSEPGWPKLRPQLEALVQRGRARDALREKVRAHASESVFGLELDSLIAALKGGMVKPWPLNWFACRGVRKTAKGVWKGRVPENAGLLAALDDARTVRGESTFLASEQSEGARFFGRAWKGGEGKWEELAGQIEWADGLRALIAQAPTDGLGGAVCTAAVRCSTSGIDELHGEPSPPLARALAGAVEAWKVLVAAWGALAKAIEVQNGALPPPGAPDHLPQFRGMLARWKTGLSELNDWCYWRRARAGIDGVIEPLAVALESGACAAGALGDAFERAFARQWLSAVGDAEPLLRDFNAGAHEGAIARFRELDRRGLELAAQVAAARVGQRVPSRMNVGNGGGGAAGAPGSEMGVLSHQLALQRRHMPVRKLIGKLPNVLPRLKPCFLMSPLSVAQYLDPAYPPFDVVVFDEASQIPVWDAVGAIARGESVVVVGDSKQLPPTNFFQKLDGEEGGPGDEEDFEELESVLDECTASGLPALRLLWHYRSRHESLIAFSNYHYYDNRLLTFPGPEERSREMGVSLRLVEGGVYDRGGARTNRAEAEAIVAEIVERVRSRRETLGVVTFSQAQQTLIEDLLDARRRDSAELDAALGAGEEPVFVKNLENVQGDERDVILFSVCYAPDKTGRMAMSFGPLNRAGGERRLNVAVTRARRQVVVFSSIRADQIDLGRTRSVGAAHLKTFLDYAERGPASIGEAAAASAGAGAMTALERDVRRELEARGWQVDEQVGCSGYRIDLAVRDPARPGRYLLGIECDGRAYRSAQTARDRDRLRSSVLEGLGWRLHRVWSMQWRRNRARALQGIEDALRAAQAAPAVEPKPSAPMAAAPIAQAAGQEIEAGAIDVVAGLGAQPYLVFAAARRPGTADEFHSLARTRDVAATIREVVRHEGPIVPELLARRVAAMWGVERVTARVEARVAEALAADGSRDRPVLVGDAYWASDAAAAEFAGFREPGDDALSRRDAEHIPTIEAANAAAAVLGAHIALAESELVRQTAIALGFVRPTERIAAEMRRGIAELVRRGGCELADGQARLPR